MISNHDTNSVFQKVKKRQGCDICFLPSEALSLVSLISGGKALMGMLATV